MKVKNKTHLARVYHIWESEGKIKGLVLLWKFYLLISRDEVKLYHSKRFAVVVCKNARNVHWSLVGILTQNESNKTLHYYLHLKFLLKISCLLNIKHSSWLFYLMPWSFLLLASKFKFLEKSQRLTPRLVSVFVSYYKYNCILINYNCFLVIDAY